MNTEGQLTHGDPSKGIYPDPPPESHTPGPALVEYDRHVAEDRTRWTLAADMVFREKADAAIAELKAENKEMRAEAADFAAAAPTCCQCGAPLTITSDGPITTRVCPSGCDIVARVARREEREG